METHIPENTYCRKQDKSVAKDSCRRCDEFLATDFDNLFNKCNIEFERFEVLYKIFKRRNKKESSNE